MSGYFASCPKCGRDVCIGATDPITGGPLFADARAVRCKRCQTILEWEYNVVLNPVPDEVITGEELENDIPPAQPDTRMGVVVYHSGGAAVFVYRETHRWSDGNEHATTFFRHMPDHDMKVPQGEVFTQTTTVDFNQLDTDYDDLYRANHPEVLKLLNTLDADK